jgi:outer membrane immunogenic protein
VNTRWLGTVRGRLGFLVTPTALVYATGGLAYGNVTATGALAQVGNNGFIGAGAVDFSQTRGGWTAGFGAEWMLWQNWSAKAEYLHYDLGTASSTWSALGTPASTFFRGVVYQTEVSSFRFRGDIVRVGLNYHFGGSGVARY